MVDMPVEIAKLPRDKHGRPVPWFVAFNEVGVPDFRVVRHDGDDALRFSWCWICGQPRGRHAAFVIGPMCAVNRVSSEPPAHLRCATYAARTCPFLTTPTMRRRERDLGPKTDPPGEMILRNPGVALVWSSRTWSTFQAEDGLLFDVGEPSAVQWYAHGREATRAEITASIDSGLPALREQAEQDGPGSVAELDRMHTAALALIPGET